MARDIRYTRTEDGVSIAYRVSGRGEAVISMPFLPFASLDSEVVLSAQRLEFEESALLVEYDSRGFGLSEKGSDYSLDSLAAELTAVVAALGVSRFSLISSGQTAMAGIHYAAHHPELVMRLVLIAPVSRGAIFWDQGSTQAFRALRTTDWETYKNVLARMTQRVPIGLGMMSELDFKGVSEEAVAAFMDAFVETDVTPDLPNVRAETLVVHLTDNGFTPIEASREVASMVPNARLAVVAGEGDERTIEIMGMIADFFGVPVSVHSSKPPSTSDSAGFKGIMFTDLEGSTTLTQRLGDQPAQEVIRSHDRIVRTALEANGGREIKHTGDGIMASFDTASSAVECAIEIQRKVAASHLEVRVRIGINAGEPVAEGDDLFGTAVQLARRICDHGEGGDILVANVVRELAAGKGFAFADRGETVLKGFEDATRIYAVSWSE